MRENIELRDVTAGNWQAVVGLELSPEQQDLVASNAESLDEARSDPDARRSAGAPHRDERRCDRGRLFIQQSVFIAGGNHAMADQQAGHRESLDVASERCVDGAGHHSTSSAIISPSSSVPISTKPKLA